MVVLHLNDSIRPFLLVSEVTGVTMKRRFSFVLGALLLSASLLLTGCQTDATEGTDTIEVFWKSSYGDGYEIKNNILTAYANDNRDVTYKGTIVNSPSYTATSGSLTLHIFDSTEVYAPYNNTYYVVQWQNFNGISIKISTPYKEGTDYQGLTDKEAAESEYTIANGYYGYFAEYAYVKQ